MEFTREAAQAHNHVFRTTLERVRFVGCDLRGVLLPRKCTIVAHEFDLTFHPLIFGGTDFSICEELTIGMRSTFQEDEEAFVQEVKGFRGSYLEVVTRRPSLWQRPALLSAVPDIAKRLRRYEPTDRSMVIRINNSYMIVRTNYPVRPIRMKEAMDFFVRHATVEHYREEPKDEHEWKQAQIVDNTFDAWLKQKHTPVNPM